MKSTSCIRSRERHVIAEMKGLASFTPAGRIPIIIFSVRSLRHRFRFHPCCALSKNLGATSSIVDDVSDPPKKKKLRTNLKSTSLWLSPVLWRRQVWNFFGDNISLTYLLPLRETIYAIVLRLLRSNGAEAAVDNAIRHSRVADAHNACPLLFPSRAFCRENLWLRKRMVQKTKPRVCQPGSLGPDAHPQTRIYPLILRARAAIPCISSHCPSSRGESDLLCMALTTLMLFCVRYRTLR